MQNCFNLANLIARDKCQAALFGNASATDISGLAIVAVIVACAIGATLACKYL